MNSTKEIEKLLIEALLLDGEMDHRLYEYELAEQAVGMRESLIQDRDEYIYAVTENSGSVAMLLLEANGAEYINEDARERLKTLWPEPAYSRNLIRLLPGIARDLSKGSIPLNGVKVVRS